MSGVHIAEVFEALAIIAVALANVGQPAVPFYKVENLDKSMKMNCLILLHIIGSNVHLHIVALSCMLIV